MRKIDVDWLEADKKRYGACCLAPWSAIIRIRIEARGGEEREQFSA
jgi:hypothetical protein